MCIENHSIGRFVFISRKPERVRYQVSGSVVMLKSLNTFYMYAIYVYFTLMFDLNKKIVRIVLVEEMVWFSVPYILMSCIFAVFGHMV